MVELVTGNPPDAFHVWFGLGAVGITKDEKIIIDCTRIEAVKGGAQGIFPPKLFIEKSQGTL